MGKNHELPHAAVSTKRTHKESLSCPPQLPPGAVTVLCLCSGSQPSLPEICPIWSETSKVRRLPLVTSMNTVICGAVMTLTLWINSLRDSLTNTICVIYIYPKRQAQPVHKAMSAMDLTISATGAKEFVPKNRDTQITWIHSQTII